MYKRQIVKSIKGSQGGYFLSRPPQEITVSSIIEALEGCLLYTSAHQYIGNYDSTVRFHYDSESAKADIISERAVKILINSYLMIMVIIVDMIIFYTMCQMELKEIILRERFLKNLGMSGKERRKVYRKEICFYYVSPTCIMLAAMVLFLRAVLRARMFPETIAETCIRMEGVLTAGVLLLRLLYIVAVYQVFSRKAGMRDER